MAARKKISEYFGNWLIYLVWLLMEREWVIGRRILGMWVGFGEKGLRLEYDQCSVGSR